MRHSTTKPIALLVQVTVPPLLTCWTLASDFPARNSGSAGRTAGAGCLGEMLNQLWSLLVSHVLHFWDRLLEENPGSPHPGPFSPLLSWRWAQGRLGGL